MNIIPRNWNGRTIRQRSDGYMSATDMCIACGKRWDNWNRLDSTKDYLEALKNKHYSDVSEWGLVDSKVGGLPDTTGTWVYRKVAIRLAQWLSADFAIQVDEWIEELLTTGKVQLSNESPQQPKYLPALEQADKAISIAERYEKVFGKINPQIEQHLKDLIGNTLLEANKSTTEQIWMGVVNFAEVELGYSVPKKGEHRDSALGLWIRFYYPKLSSKQERRLCNETQQNIYVYPIHDVRDELANAVHEFFADSNPGTKLRLDGAFKRKGTKNNV
jgi:hypothetical protein